MYWHILLADFFSKKNNKQLKTSFIILSFFTAGILLGYLDLLPDKIYHSDYDVYALYLLMFLVGIGIGSDKNALVLIKKLKLTLFLVPTTVIVGTFIGVSIIAVFLKEYNYKDIVAVGFGFGYYSLSSIFITEISGEKMGIIALLSNVIRESITLLLAPVIAKYFGKIAPIASAGATSMDTTLPIIIISSGKQYAIISVFNGIVLTILVPILIVFILEVL